MVLAWMTSANPPALYEVYAFGLTEAEMAEQNARQPLTDAEIGATLVGEGELGILTSTVMGGDTDRVSSSQRQAATVLRCLRRLLRNTAPRPPMPTSTMDHAAGSGTRATGDPPLTVMEVGIRPPSAEVT